MSKIPFLKIVYSNDFELIEKLLKIYDVSKPEVFDKKTGKPLKLRDFEREALKYYIRYGYSKETKNIIERDLKKKLNAIVQIDYLLKEAGYLEDMENNFRMKKLNPYLEKIRQDFILKKNRVYGLHFSNE